MHNKSNTENDFIERTLFTVEVTRQVIQSVVQKQQKVAKEKGKSEVVQEGKSSVQEANVNQNG